MKNSLKFRSFLELNRKDTISSLNWFEIVFLSKGQNLKITQPFETGPVIMNFNLFFTKAILNQNDWCFERVSFLLYFFVGQINNSLNCLKPIYRKRGEVEWKSRILIYKILTIRPIIEPELKFCRKIELVFLYIDGLKL